MSRAKAVFIPPAELVVVARSSYSKQADREDLRIFPVGLLHRRRRRCFCRIHPRASCRVVWKYSLGVMPYSFLKARKKWL